MHPVLQHLIATDFADLQGSSIDGQIALSDELINLGLMDMLNKLKNPAPGLDSGVPSPQASKSQETKESMPDPAALLQKLQVDHLKYRTENGRTILEVKAGI